MMNKDKHKIVVGLGFGDEGKGTIVDALCVLDYYRYVVRFSGGPQAAHNVVTEIGDHHTFAQFGSGTFSGTPTILSRFMLVNPFNLAKEAEALAEKIQHKPMDRIFFSENSLVITPYHVEANRNRERERGDSRHGSCGEGVGEAQRFALDFPDLALRMKDLTLDHDSLTARLSIIKMLLEAEVGPLKSRTPANLATMYWFWVNDNKPKIETDAQLARRIAEGPCVFEGSQGVLLDEWYGFHPYTTWSTTTPENALTLLSEAGLGREDAEVIGVTRTYHTRHGAGPFPSEMREGRGVNFRSVEKHNGFGEFQGDWRVGDLDLTLLDYARQVVGKLDGVAVTHMDVRSRLRVSHSGSGLFKSESPDLEYQESITKSLQSIKRESLWYTRMSNDDIPGIIGYVLRAPVVIESYGPRSDQKVVKDVQYSGGGHSKAVL